MILIKRFIWLLREGVGLHWEITPSNEEVLFAQFSGKWVFSWVRPSLPPHSRSKSQRRPVIITLPAVVWMRLCLSCTLPKNECNDVPLHSLCTSGLSTQFLYLLKKIFFGADCSLFEDR